MDVVFTLGFKDNEEAAAGSPSSTSAAVAVSMGTFITIFILAKCWIRGFLGTALVVMEAASCRVDEYDRKVKNVVYMGLVGTQD